MTHTITFEVQVGDIIAMDADVIALKFAEGFYGADKAVSAAFGKTFIEVKESAPSFGDHRLFHTLGRINAEYALYINVGYLSAFDYEKIRKFAADVLQILAEEAPTTRHLAMTIHGVGYGLDEAEALRSQLAGYLDAFDSRSYPLALEQITIVELDLDRAQRLRSVLNDAIPGSEVVLAETKEPSAHRRSIMRSPLTDNVGRESAAKPHIFVAMSFAEEMDDVYYYGIQTPVNASGYLCERADLTPFTGDILERVKSRIETASFVIAELTTTNPNVYLELGYAWGKSRPTILLIKDAEKLPFDVRGQRCLIYSRIRDLEEKLTQELQGLNDNTI